MGCWFIADDIANFKPTERYITGKALIERWGEQPSIQPVAYILAKIRESRLEEYHPTCGGTEVTFSGMGSFPPLETGLFALSHIKEIEASDFGSDESPANNNQLGHLNHDQQLQLQANEIAAELTATTKRVPTKDKVAKNLAKKLGIDEATVLRRIRKQWK